MASRATPVVRTNLVSAARSKSARCLLLLPLVCSAQACGCESIWALRKKESDLMRSVDLLKFERASLGCQSIFSNFTGFY